jgi:hypothetical protein
LEIKQVAVNFDKLRNVLEALKSVLAIKALERA